MKSSHLFKTTLIGSGLGLGAPLGFIFLSYFWYQPLSQSYSLWGWVLYLFNQSSFYLVYLTVPTLIVFSAFAYFHGRQEQKLAHKNYQMDEILHLVAHDIRNPLTIIKQAAGINLDSGEVAFQLIFPIGK